MTASDTPPPLTDEELDAIRDRLSVTAQVDYVADESTIADFRRVLTEMTRLRAELATVSDEAGVQCREAAARTVRAEKERDALAAKLAAVIDVITVKNPDWKPLTERHPEYFKPVSPEEAARKKGWKQGVDLLTQQIRAALGETGGTDA